MWSLWRESVGEVSRCEQWRTL